jgi:large subunit ribosomal protein L15
MKLELLKPNKGSVRNNERVGRGQGSGGGGTAKRGHKGAKSRSGYSKKRGFEGGQMPLQRRVPKFGFNNINRIEYKAINLDLIQSLVEKKGVSVIDIAFLRENGLLSKFDLVKVLGRGELTSKVSVTANAFSQSAIDAIEKLGGSTTIVNKSGNIANAENSETKVAVKAPKTIKEVKVEKVAAEPIKEAVVIETAKIEEVVEVPVEAPVVEEKVVSDAIDVVKEPKKSTKKGSDGDNLKLIEGIGPKIAEVLTAAGVDTFAKLSTSDFDTLKAILAEAGGNLASHNPTTWPQQAALAAAGQWDELKELQEKLLGGRPE